MPYRSFFIPREIYYGPGAIEALANIPGERVLIVTDPGVRKAGLVERVEEILKTKSAEVAVFDQVEPDSSKGTVWSIFSLAQDFQPDLLIGLGGGSSIDSGKGAWILYEHPDLAACSLLEAMPEIRRRRLRQKARYVAIATTSGTGSEVSSGAVIADRDLDPPFKVAWASPQLIPDVAIADAELAASMPPEVTANTGFDALVHAIESYVLTPPSDLNDPLALWAAKTIWEWLPKAVADGKDMLAREKMSLAALQAGIPMSNGRLSTVHLAAHQLGAVLGIPHGRANAFMLCPAFAFLYPTHRERLSSLATNLGIRGKDDLTKVGNLLTSLDELKQKVGIPLSMKEAGIDESPFQAKLGPMAESYIANLVPAAVRLTPERRRAAGIPMTTDEVRELLAHAWDGTRAELR